MSNHYLLLRYVKKRLCGVAKRGFTLKKGALIAYSLDPDWGSNKNEWSLGSYFVEDVFPTWVSGI